MMLFSFPYGRQRRCIPAVKGAPALEVENLVVRYNRQSPPVLRGVNLSIANHGRVALVGPNGCGKSTLLKTIVGILTPTEGEVRTFGVGTGTCHHRVAYLPQRDQVMWAFPITVEQVVLAGRFVHLGWMRKPRQQDYERAREALASVGIADLATRSIHDLSGGQRQRVMIARALAQEADLLLFDEPLNALDAEAKATLRDVLDQLAKMGKTFIVATHDFEGFDGLFDQVIALENGVVVEHRLTAA